MNNTIHLSFFEKFSICAPNPLVKQPIFAKPGLLHGGTASYLGWITTEVHRYTKTRCILHGRSDVTKDQHSHFRREGDTALDATIINSFGYIFSSKLSYTCTESVIILSAKGYVCQRINTSNHYFLKYDAILH